LPRFLRSCSQEPFRARCWLLNAVMWFGRGRSNTRDLSEVAC
jgi:hypothetical protein